MYSIESFRLVVMEIVLAVTFGVTGSVVSSPPLADSFDPVERNMYSWHPAEAKFVRLWVACDHGQPCIDEMEIFGTASDENLALSAPGVKVEASSCFPDNSQHRVEHINDGVFGNASSWIPRESEGWIQVEFPEVTTVERMSLSRDFKEKNCRDRVPDQMEILVSMDGKEWTSVKKVEKFSNFLDRNNNDRPMNTPETVRRAVKYLCDTYGDRYSIGTAALEKIDEFESRFDAAKAGSKEYEKLEIEFSGFQREVLLASPALDFDRVLLIRGNRMAAPNNNFVTLDEVPKSGFDNELAVLSNLRDTPTLTTVYRSPNGRPIGEAELHWDGEKIMFSSIAEENRRWGVFEIRIDGTGLKTLTPTDQPDVDFFDSCYVPDGSIITASTATMQGLPCLNGGASMVNLFKINPETKQVRQLTFEQDSDWHPTMMRDGRIMYMRWEYTDLMHYFSRILFTMNPDGTNQRELYGSGSLFPTTLKHAREIPGSSEIIVILSGHHGRGDTGRMAIIDPGVARKYPFNFKPKTKEWGIEGKQTDIHPEVLSASQTGFIQELPGYGRDVVGNVLDNQADGLKYNFVFPYPVSRNEFLVSCQIEGDNDTYGLYLIDRFDNMTLIEKIPGQGLFNPIPVVKRPQPLLRADQVVPDEKTSTVFVTDIYDGEGMRGVPRGTVKNLRVFAYHFAYRQRGGHDVLGVHSGWDVKRILGDVPVEKDGSIIFEMPSNTPVSLQPLDEQGRAVQLMRSWTIGMPGEFVSCNGCHESQLDVTPTKTTVAARRAAHAVVPVYGPPHSVTFETDVYHPIVKKYCMECHDGKNDDVPSFASVRSAYENIHPFVRRPGPETDMAVLRPMEYHASTSELCQMLDKNHYNVKLDDKAKRLLYCWIDLNAPYGGKWDHPEQAKRRREIEELYTNIVNDHEGDFDRYLALVRQTSVTPVSPEKRDEKSEDDPELKKKAEELARSNVWPFGHELARSMQAAGAKGGSPTKDIALSKDVKMRFAFIPAGTFVLGSLSGYPDEAPRAVVRIENPFWMATTEVTNAQYALFDPEHDSRYIEEHGKDHIVPGYIANHPDQPVSRISWDEARGFAAWFSNKYNVSADLPTEAEWEWAARAGTGTDFYFGTSDDDFSPFANLAGAERRRLKTGWINGSTIHRRDFYPKESVFPLRDDRFEDQWFTVDYVARYKPNPWGLYDMIGNNAEWTKSEYRAYPYKHDDGRNDPALRGRKTARGGSWHDRPKVTGAATRYPYESWQKVHNVGIRLILH